MKTYQINANDFSPFCDAEVEVSNKVKFLKINYAADYMVFLTEDEVRSWIDDYDEDEEVVEKILSLKLGESYDPTGCECFVRIA